MCQPDDINRGWQYGLVGGAIYIYHFIFLTLVFKREMPSGTTSVTNWILGCIVVLVATYGLSYISWKFLEAPAINWSKRFLSK